MRFDLGAILVTDDLTVMDALANCPIGKLRVVAKHQVDIEALQYHRSIHG